MTEIAINDRVSFTERTTYRPYLHTVTGVVVDLLPWTPCALALVEREDGLMDKLVPVSELSVVEAADDVQDVLAVSDRPFEMIADDYSFMTGEAGNLGGTEI